MTLYCGTHNWLYAQRMLNHGLNHGFFLSLFKLKSFPIHWIVCVSLFKFHIWILELLVLPKMAGFAKTHKSMSFIWIVWSTLYVYLCCKLKLFRLLFVCSLCLCFSPLGIVWYLFLQDFSLSLYKISWISSEDAFSFH